MGKDEKSKMPWDRADLDPNSSYAPPGSDPARVMEKIAEEAARLEQLKTSGALSASLLAAPETETQVSQLGHSQRLVSLLFACGASVMDIALELGTTAEQVSLFENNRLIAEQIQIYKERFFSSDPQAQLREMLPDGIKFLRQVLDDDSIVDADKKLDTVRWLVEKITGKAVQQVDVSASLNFGHLLDEMKKMKQVRDEMTDGNPQSLSGFTQAKDVTPPEQDKFEAWVDDWQKRRLGGPK